MRPGREERGFTLIEVLVATAIAALFLLPLLRGFSTGAILNARSRAASEATVIAESEMDAIGATDLTQDRPIDRQMGRFHLTGSVHRYGGWTASGKYQPTAVPYEIAVTVSWQQGATRRFVSLRTLRLGAVAPSSQE